MTNTYTWTTPRGAKIAATITVEHITRREISADGFPVEVNCNEWIRKIDNLTVNGKATALKELSNYKGQEVIVIARRGMDKTMIAIPANVVDAIYGEERTESAARLDRAIKAEKEYLAHVATVESAMNQ